MLKKLLAITLTFTLVSISGLALAKHGHELGGKSADLMSATGFDNTNGHNAADRDKGQEHATDRHSDKAEDKTEKHMYKHHGKKK